MKFSASLARPMSRRRAGLLIVSVVAITGTLFSAPGAIASWTRDLAGTGSAAAGTISTASTLTTRDARVSNEDYQTTHVVEVQNIPPAGSTYTGTSDAVLTIDAMANTGLAALMSVTVWPVASAADCTVTAEPTGVAVSGAWTSTLASAPSPVAPNTSAYFCVRGYPTDSTPLPSSPATAAAQNRSNVAAQLGSASTLSFTPTFSAQLARGNFTASATTTPTSALSTFRIFPFSQLVAGVPYVARPVLEDGVTGLCFNIRAGGNTTPPGAGLITWSCSGAAITPRNERFVEVPVPGTSSFQLRADSTNATFGFLESSLDGSVVQSQVGDATNLRQRWIGQVLGNGSRQLVNAETGFCLFAPSASNMDFTTQPCNNVRGEASDWSVAGL